MPNLNGKNHGLLGFRLAQFIIVIAVGVVIAALIASVYFKYEKESKLRAAESNHKAAFSLLSNSFTSCNAGARYIILAEEEIPCNIGFIEITPYIIEYLTSISKNPYNKEIPSIMETDDATAGQVAVVIIDKTIFLSTDHDDDLNTPSLENAILIE